MTSSKTFPELLVALGREGEREAACLELATYAWDKDKAAMLRLTSPALAGLISLFKPVQQEKVEATGSQPHEEGTHLQVASMEVAINAAKLDKLFKEALFAEDVIRKVWSYRLLDSSPEVVLRAVRLIFQCIYGKNANAAAEVIFQLGVASRIARFFDSGTSSDLSEAAANIMFNISNLSRYRERIRDLGIIPRIMQLCGENPKVIGYMGTIYNLSRSAALHITLHENNLLGTMKLILRDANVEALIALAHVYGGQDGQEAKEVQELLSSHDISTSVIAMMDVTLHGDGFFREGHWVLEEVVHSVTSLSRNEDVAKKLVSLGVIPMLKEAVLKHSDDSDAVMHAVQAFLNLSLIQELHPKMIQDGAVDAIKGFQESSDAKVADAAKGCLLQLGLLDNRQAVEAMNQADNSSSPDQKYDVFLSHKRSDAKDYARALFNLLVLRGISTFLDFEYREELELENGLGRIIANCRNVIVIMTDNLFESEYCIKEMEAAIECKCNIILVVKEGSRWVDAKGNKTATFPTAETLEKLRPDVQKLFSRKAIMHSDEYYQTFAEMLLHKIIVHKESESAVSGGVQAERSLADSVTSVAQPWPHGHQPQQQQAGGFPIMMNPYGGAGNGGGSGMGVEASMAMSHQLSVEISKLRMDMLLQLHEMRGSFAAQFQELRGEVLKSIAQVAGQGGDWSQVKSELASLTHACTALKNSSDGTAPVQNHYSYHYYQTDSPDARKGAGYPCKRGEEGNQRNAPLQQLRPPPPLPPPQQQQDQQQQQQQQQKKTGGKEAGACGVVGPPGAGQGMGKEGTRLPFLTSVSRPLARKLGPSIPGTT